MEIKKPKNLKRSCCSFKIYGMQLLKFLTLFLLLITALNVSAQMVSINQDDYNITLITSCNSNPYVQSGEYTASYIILPAAVQGTDYCFNIPLHGTLAWSDIDPDNSEFEMSLISCTVKPTFETDMSGNYTGNIIWSAADICIPPGIQTHWEIDYTIVDNVGNEESGIFRLPVLRNKPVKIVYVLDRSGSMGWTIPLASGTSTLIRWNVLKDAVVRFTDLTDEFLQYNDAVSVSYFANNVITTGEDISNGFITISPGTQISNTLENSMTGQTPQGSTAMGLGLLDGKQKLLNPVNDATKFVLLFTDGEQNVSPEVLSDGLNLDDGSSSLQQSTCVLSSPDEKCIKYLTIGMGNGVPALGILSDIAIANNGGFQATDGSMTTDIDPLFNNYMFDILKGNSPQIVARKTGKLINEQNTTKFSINGSCNKIVFELTHYKGHLMNLIIEKDGDTITSAFNLKSKPYYKILSLDLPYKSSKGYIYSEGEWKVTVTGNSEETFNLTCITDDHYLNYDCSTDYNLYTVGDSIRFSVDLSYAGTPLIGETDTVKAVILKPGDDIGHLLATFATPEFDQDSIYGDSVSGFYQKYTELMYNNSDFYTSLLPDSQIVILEHQGDGHYTGFFDKTELTGIYQIYFLLKGEIPDRGTFIREEIKTSVFEYGNNDDQETVVDIDITQGKTGSTAVITVKPKNKYGYYMGPGYLSKLKINYKRKAGAKFQLLRTKINKTDNTEISDPIIESMIDNLDGSYTFKIINLPLDAVSDDFQITVFDQIVESTCYPVTIWYYVILALIILILIYAIVKKYNKSYKILLILILIVWIVYIILRYAEILCYKFL